MLTKSLAQCIYAITKRVIFAVAEEELEGGKVEVLSIILDRQISYLADLEGLDGLFEHLGDNPWAKVFEIILGGFSEEHPRRPFALWGDVEADFKDLVARLTNFDPKKRITAHEALAHKWFADV
jgi:serine/threonine protein kinase